MNFFEHQQRARAASRRLLTLFALAVAGVVLAVNAAAALLYGWVGAAAGPGVAAVTAGGATLGGQAPLGLHAGVTLLTALLILGGSWFETMRLRAGGDAVARMIGARPVDPATRDLLERRLLNVVEEMALAAGTPVPRVYLMDGEPGINAFAAGHSVNDAVVAVTRGTLTRLSRDELQGVVAHEFSHILNGDMRLNIRLIGVLFGLTMLAVAGRFLLEVGRGGGRDSRGVALVGAAGVALLVIGWIGVFFGRLIKAGVSRSREFLADASAVQFTRNPEGIGGALRKIAGLPATPDFALGARALGTEIAHPHAETLSHLFLGAARRAFAGGMLATHPPLAERIRRIYGRPMQPLPAPEQPVALALDAAPAADVAAAPAHATDRALVRPAMADGDRGLPSPLTAFAAASAPASAALAQAIGAQPDAAARDYAHEFNAQVHALGLEPVVNDSVRAQLLVLAMLVEKRSGVAATQHAAIAQALGEAAARQVEQLHARVAQLPPGARLPLLDLAMPALRKLPAVSADRLLMLAHTLIVADGRMTLGEFLLYTVLRRRIGSDSQRPVPLRYGRLQELADDARRVLSLLAHARLPADPARAYAAGAVQIDGLAPTPLAPAELALDDVARALDRLNQLVPLAKPALIGAAAAVALFDGRTTWQAASGLRTVCAALDAPLPPQVAATPTA